MKELNKKLAEWAGRCWNEWQFHPPLFKRATCKKCGLAVWIEASDPEYDKPNFTESLDACFEWFRPKFKSMACGLLNEDDWKGAWAKVIPHNGESAWVRELGIEPALALCLAIEKLIDKENTECIEDG